jgi:hypothetical protein
VLILFYLNKTNQDSTDKFDQLFSENNPYYQFQNENTQQNQEAQIVAVEPLIQESPKQNNQ